MTTALQEIAQADGRGSEQPFRGEIYEYGANLDLQNGYAVKGNFEIARSKYLMAPFQAIRDQRIRVVVIVAAVQTGKSLLADISVPYWIEHDPGDTLWLLQDDKFVETYMNARFIPLLKRAKSLGPTLEMAGKFGVKKDELLLPHMSVMMGGLNEGNVQSFSRRNVIIDEAWLAENNGLIRQAKERAAAYPHTSKIMVLSQAGTEGDDLDLEWKESNMQQWAWQCPACKKHQPFEMSAKRNDGSWAGMRWETNEFTRPNGRWNYPAVAKTARLECYFCGGAVDDTPAKRRLLDDTHTYIAENPGADATIAGFSWPQIANIDISFGKFLTKYLSAKDQQENHGYDLPLKQWYQKQYARAWNINTSADYRRVSYEPYDIIKEWPEEAYRFLTVDCQKDFKDFWVVVRAWAKTGESRQLARARLETWEAVAKFQEEWKVRDQDVGVDCGYEQTKVAQECVRHGHIGTVGGRKYWLCWVALKGMKQEHFTHENPRTKTKERRIYSPLDWLDPNIGQAGGGHRCPVILFSNLSAKDILRRHRDGEAAKFLSLPDTAPASDMWSYTAQMNSEIRVKERDENGKMISIWKPIGKRPNHQWDDEVMQIVRAANAGIIGEAPPTESEKA